MSDFDAEGWQSPRSSGAPRMDHRKNCDRYCDSFCAPWNVIANQHHPRRQQAHHAHGEHVWGVECAARLVHLDARLHGMTKRPICMQTDHVVEVVNGVAPVIANVEPEQVTITAIIITTMLANASTCWPWLGPTPTPAQPGPTRLPTTHSPPPPRDNKPLIIATGGTWMRCGLYCET